ncbi:DUF2752 domain-containing protein [Micromonospora sp. SL4-19]|uniref:DUF2752 domain-containing protein n=1 Tax=Micromonospora sp. SL4-19 TaxID=3399129 RepID=UPI003A4D607B
MYGEPVTSADRPAAPPDPQTVPVPPAAAGPAVAGSHAEGAAAAAVAEPGSAIWPAGAAYQPVEEDRFTRLVIRLHARAPRWAVPLAALGCVGMGMAYALLSDPTHSEPDARPTCLLKLTTGLDCPGCGGTRALWYVLHGNLPAAARHHFVFVFALPFLAYLFASWAGNRAFGWRLPELRLSPKVLGGFLAVWFAFSVARNLPWAPFTSLYV